MPRSVLPVHGEVMGTVRNGGVGEGGLKMHVGVGDSSILACSVAAVKPGAF